MALHSMSLSSLITVLALTPGLAATAAEPPVAGAPDETPWIDPKLQQQFAASDETGYLIYFRQRADLTPAHEMGWTERGRFVVDALRRTAEETQPRVREYLARSNIRFEAFWIDNVIAIESSDLATFQGLQRFSEIEALRANPEVKLIEPVETSAAAARLFTVEPNLEHVNAPDVWEMGFKGQGMVVGSIDSGVRYTHEALVAQYRGNLGGGSFDHDQNWWDATGGTSAPTDGHGHGSHTMGTMVGDDGGTNQIGIAPGAQWIACRACPDSSCPAVLECAQFMVAPWDLEEENPNPDLRPHVVNNSWGGCGQSYNGWYQGVVDAWHAAGIVPVFSNGNASNCDYPVPPGCNTVGNPARYANVLSVGSTGTSDGEYAPHSNWGPTDNPWNENPLGFPTIKPNVVAPGVSIRSAVQSSDDVYGQKTGTSMSAPHVAGLVALLWQAAPCLVGDYVATARTLMTGSTAIPYDTQCGGEGPANVPNHATGWGEIDALAIVNAGIDACTSRPRADIAPGAFTFDVPRGAGDSDVLSIGNLGPVELEWSIITDAPEGAAGGHDPALDEPLDIPDFSIDSPAAGGEPVTFNVAAGVLTQGDVIGFSFIGTASGISGNGSWASNTCMIVEAPDGTVFGVGGLGGTDPNCDVHDWDFQGPGSTEDGTYESTHDYVFPGVEDEGDWTFTFINDWNIEGAPTISWSDVTVTLHKVEPPPCKDVAEVAWLSVDPESGTTAAASTTPVDVTIDTTGLAVGTFAADLCVTTNDPWAPLVPVPVTLTVSEAVEAYAPIALAVDSSPLGSDGNGVFEPGEQVEVAPSWRNDGTAAQELEGSASGLTGPTGAAYTVVADHADYGILDPNQTADCHETGVCYQMGVDDPAARPARHWDAAFDETLSDASTQTWVLHLGDSFTDVPRGSLFYAAIEALLHHGVTGGCGGTEYCPAETNTRGQMAVFLLRAIEGGDFSPPACEPGSERFDDVPATNAFCSWIEELAARGVTSGCGGDNYCPADPVTRAQMAVFLLRALEGPDYTPPACLDVFTDVPCPSTFADWVEELANRDVTSGCSQTEYCPAALVTRGQMASFIVRAFGLRLYRP